jgi:hypothetical protein
VALHCELTLMTQDRDESIFQEVWHDCWKSLFLFGSLLIGILLLGSIARWLGLALFTIFALVTLKDILRLLMAIGLGVLVLPFTIMAAFKIRSNSDVGNGVYLLNANAIILMQLFVLVGYNFFLYNHFFITGNIPLP